MRALSWLLRVITAGGLAVDAYVHFTRAPDYEGAPGAISQATMFRAESIAAIVVAVLVLVTGARIAWLLAFLVGISAVVAVLISRYTTLGPIGPFGLVPEADWTTPGKILATIAEAVVTVVALVGVGVGTMGRTRVSEGAGAG